MHFGRIDTDLSQIDFTLPKDPALTTDVLKSSKGDEPLRITIGSTKWGAKEWVGTLYPPKTKDAEFLDEYVKHFDAIELNATFYKVHPPYTIEAWRKKAQGNPRFKFCPKFPQSISHVRRLKNAKEITNEFLAGVYGFDNALGPLFLQLSDNFSPKSFPDLKTYLESLPKDLQFFVEIRHKNWYADDETRNELFELLRSLNMGAVISDAAGRRDCVHMTLPIPHAFIRFVGNGDDSDTKRLNDWVQRIGVWRDLGLQSLYFFLHQQQEALTPFTAQYLCDQFNEKLGIDVKSPRFYK